MRTILVFALLWFSTATLAQPTEQLTRSYRECVSKKLVEGSDGTVAANYPVSHSSCPGIVRQMLIDQMAAAKNRGKGIK